MSALQNFYLRLSVSSIPVSPLTTRVGEDLHGVRARIERAQDEARLAEFQHPAHEDKFGVDSCALLVGLVDWP